MKRARAGWQPLPDPKTTVNRCATANQAMAVIPAAGRAAPVGRPSSGCRVQSINE